MATCRRIERVPCRCVALLLGKQVALRECEKQLQHTQKQGASERRQLQEQLDRLKGEVMKITVQRDDLRQQLESVRRAWAVIDTPDSI